MKKGFRLPRIAVNCRHCGKAFEALPCQIKKGRGRFCSMSCRSKVACLTIANGNKSGLWDAEKKEGFRRFHARANKDETLHQRWKGDSVGYFGVHDWISKHYGQPTNCEVCGLNDPKRKYHWANLSHKYMRDRKDFKRMCVPCHRKYDYAAARNRKLETAQ